MIGSSFQSSSTTRSIRCSLVSFLRCMRLLTKKCALIVVTDTSQSINKQMLVMRSRNRLCVAYPYVRYDRWPRWSFSFLALLGNINSLTCCFVICFTQKLNCSQRQKQNVTASAACARKPHKRNAEFIYDTIISMKL